MRCKSTVVWWREDNFGEWKRTKCETAKELPELVISFKVESIIQTDSGDKVVLNLTLNNYTSKEISMPSIINGIKQNGINLNTVSINCDPHSVINPRWQNGAYMFLKPLPEKSNVSINLEISVPMDTSDATINVLEMCMDENSPSLFEEIKLEAPNRTSYQLNNSLLFAQHGSGNRRIEGIVQLGHFDSVTDDITMTVRISDVRIDPNKAYCDGSRLQLMSMNSDPPLIIMSEKQKQDCAYPVMFIGDNKEIEMWWYIVDTEGWIYVKSPKTISKRGTLRSTTITMMCS